MRRRLKYAGSVMGLAMLCAVAGGGTSFAGEKAKQPKQTEAAAEVKAGSTEKKGTETANKTPAPTAEKKDQNVYYGRVKKLEQNKILLNEATVVWDQAAEEKATAAKDKKDAKTAEDSKNAKSSSEGTADFETDAMKWKLSGKDIEIALEDGTKFMVESEAAAGKEDAKTSKVDKTSNDAKADAKTDAKADAKAPDAEKAGSKDEKPRLVSIERKDVAEGSMVKVTLKGDGSMTASEVLLLSGVKEIKPAGAKAENAEKKTEKQTEKK